MTWYRWRRCIDRGSKMDTITMLNGAGTFLPYLFCGIIIDKIQILEPVMTTCTGTVPLAGNTYRRPTGIQPGRRVSFNNNCHEPVGVSYVLLECYGTVPVFLFR
jgi:hypothetical protein